MKRTLSLLLALAVSLAATVPAFAQTAPPGGYTPPPTNPYGTCNPYAVPEPQLAIDAYTAFTFTHQAPEGVVQWGDMPAASWAATAIVVDFTDSDNDDIEDTATVLGFLGTPAAAGKCATSSHLPVIAVTDNVIDPLGPSPEKASFYESCISEFAGLNQQLAAYAYGQFGLGSLVCLSLLRAAPSVFCLRYFPTAIGMLTVKEEYHYDRNEPIAGVAYHATIIRVTAMFNNYCVSKGVI